MPKYSRTDSTLSTQRLEAFSDSVFAIVITLLFYNLRVPEISDPENWRELLNELYKGFPKFSGIVLSFIFVAAFWVSHHQFFRTLKQTTRGLLWLNLIFLFLVCFVPFPAEVMTQHPQNETAVVFFGATLLLTSIMFSALRYYAWIKHSEISALTSKHQVRQALYRSLLFVSLHTTAFVIAFFFPTVAIVVYVSVLLVLFFPVKVEVEEETGDEEHNEKVEIKL